MDPSLASGLDVAPEDLLSEHRLRAYFAAMISGLNAGHAYPDACRKRLAATLTLLATTWSPSTYTWTKFEDALTSVIDKECDEGFYLRDPPPNTDIDVRAVTFQCAIEKAMDDWMGGIVPPAELAKAVRRGTARPGAMVGLPDRATWFTPLKGVTKDIVDSCRGGVSTTAPGQVRSLVGASWWKADWIVVAMISRAHIRHIRFLDLSSPPNLIGPVGSTVLEGRGHRHFRHWPRWAGPTDRYGRTYNLDPSARRAAGSTLAYGAQEAVRTRMPLSDFDDCVVIGRLSADDCRVDEPDEDFLDDVGGSDTTWNLLKSVMALL